MSDPVDGSRGAIWERLRRHRLTVILLAVLSVLVWAADFLGSSPLELLKGAYFWVTDQIQGHPLTIVGPLLALLVGTATVLGLNLKRHRDALAAMRSELAATQDRLERVDFGPKLETLDPVRFRTRHDDIVDARLDEIRSALRRAKATVLVSGIANELLTSKLGRSEELADFLGRGGTLRAIFIDPAGEAAREREGLEGHPDNRMFKLALKSAMNIAALQLYGAVADAANTGKKPSDTDYARVEIRIHDSVPALNLLIIDDAWAAVHHYGVRSPGSVSPRITVDLLSISTDGDDDEDRLLGIQESRAALKFYGAEFSARWTLAQGLPAEASWFVTSRTLTWKSLALIAVDGHLRLENPGEDSPVKKLNAALLEDYRHRMAAGTPLQAARQQIDEQSAQLADMETRLADAVVRAKTAGDLDGVRLRTFQDRELRRKLVADRIRTARSSIDVVGVVNEVVTSDLPDDDFLWPFFISGGAMRVMFINPAGEAVTQREALERTHQDRVIRPGDFARRTLNAINSLERYQDASLEVWVYERQPSVAMVVIDKRWALITHYGLTQKGVTTPAIEVDLAGARDATLAGGLLKYFEAEFEALLRMSGTTRWDWQQTPE